MKKYIQLLALSLLVITPAIYTACQKDKVLDEESSDPHLPFSKEITIKDSSGKNTAVLIVSGIDEQRILAYNESSFEITPLFSSTDIETDSNYSSSPDDEYETVSPIESPTISIFLAKTSLESGSIGVKLHEKEIFGGVNERACETKKYETSSTGIKVTRNAGSHLCDFQNKKHWYSSFSTICKVSLTAQKPVRKYAKQGYRNKVYVSDMCKATDVDVMFYAWDSNGGCFD